MSQQGAHSYEDKLLEFAYGELPSAEARSVEAHVKGCARCAGALESIRGVRQTMAALEPEPAPDAGLESLLAYAGQAARRIQAGPAPSHARLRRWVFSLAGVASLAVLGIVASQVAREVNPLAQKEKALAEQREEQSAVPATAAAPEPAPALAPPPAPEAQAVPQVASRDEGQVDKLGNMGNVTEGGRSSFPSAGPQVERKGAESDEGAAYASKAQVGSRAAADMRDYTQRLSKPMEPLAKKAPAKTDLDSSGWEPLTDGKGAGSPGGSTGEPLKELDAKNEDARRTLSLQPTSKDADREANDDFDTVLGAAEAQAPGESAAAQPAAEVAQGDTAARERARESTSTSAGARQQAVTPSPSTATPPAPAQPVYPLRSRQAKLQAEIAKTTERSKLIGLYSELCDVDLELGNYQPESCQHIVQYFSGTNAAKLAKNLLESQREQRMLEVEKASKAAPARQ